MEWLEHILTTTVDLAILLFELIGVAVLISSGLRGLYDMVRRSPMLRLNLANGLAMGLEFKLGSEILRTVVVREFREIFLVAGIIVLRAALTLLIHWEIKNEERHTADRLSEQEQRQQAKSVRKENESAPKENSS